jgi:hypothetical protein
LSAHQLLDKEKGFYYVENNKPHDADIERFMLNIAYFAAVLSGNWLGSVK